MVAGSQMEKLLEAVDAEMHFVTLCALQVSPELGVQVRERDAILGNGKAAQLGLTGDFFCLEQLRGVEPGAGNGPPLSPEEGEGAGPSTCWISFSGPTVGCC